MYSGAPSASLVVSDLVEEADLPRPEGRRRLNDAGMRVVDLIAERLAQGVDRILDQREVAREEPGSARATLHFCRKSSQGGEP